MKVEEFLEKLDEETIRFYKEENAIELPVQLFDTLDDVVIRLEKLRRQGKLYYFINFNGVKLYSLDVTMDKAYKEYMGCTKKQYLRGQEKLKKEAEKFEKEADEYAERELPNWIEEGKKYIYPAKHKKWKKTCIASKEGMYKGLPVEDALVIMRMLDEEKPFKNIKEKMNEQGHSGMTYSLTANILLDYAKKGPDLYRYLYGDNLTKLDRKYVSKMKLINKKLEQGIDYDTILEDVKDYNAMDITIEYLDDKKKKEKKGTILINPNDMTFKGFVKKDRYIEGKFQEDGTINFTEFYNYDDINHYCATGSEDRVFEGFREVYYPQKGIEKKDKFRVILKPVGMTFRDEIIIEEKLEGMKNNFNMVTKDVYDFFMRNIDSEASRVLLSIREDSIEKQLVKNKKNEEE